jgi:hypothetical protein
MYKAPHPHLEEDTVSGQDYKAIKKEISEWELALRNHGFLGAPFHHLDDGLGKCLRHATLIAMMDKKGLQDMIDSERVPFPEGFMDGDLFKKKRNEARQRIKIGETKLELLHKEQIEKGASMSPTELSEWRERLEIASNYVARQKTDLMILARMTKVDTREYFKNVLRIANRLISLEGNKSRLEVDDAPSPRCSKKSKKDEENSLGSSQDSQESCEPASADSHPDEDPWSPSRDLEDGELAKSEGS